MLENKNFISGNVRIQKEGYYL